MHHAPDRAFGQLHVVAKRNLWFIVRVRPSSDQNANCHRVGGPLALHVSSHEARPRIMTMMQRRVMLRLTSKVSSNGCCLPGAAQ